jgi:hypothetical protein
LSWGIEAAESLRADIDRVRSSPHALAALFEELASRVGTPRASELWWAAFAATDASET